MRDYAKNVERKKKGGEMFAILFFVLLIPLTVLLFLATSTVFGRKDSLLQFVPAKTVLYLHGGGSSAKYLADALMSVPTELHPHEVAMFRVVSDDGSSNDMVLLGWSVLRQPSVEEQRALAARLAVQLGPTTYVLGDGALAARTAAETHASLADDTPTARALWTMRSISTFQAFVGRSLLDTLSTEPLVAGITQTDLLTKAVIVPVRVAALSYPLGFHVSPSTSAIPPLNASTAAAVISEAKPSFDPLTMLLGERSTAGTAPALPATPVQMSLFPNADTGEVSILLHFPTLSVKKLAPMIEKYTSVAWPEHQPFIMPDNDTALELIVNRDRYHFSPRKANVKDTPYPTRQDTSIAGAMSFSMERPTRELIIAPDKNRGSYLTTDIALLDTPHNKPEDISGCPQLHSESSLIMHIPEMFLSSQPLVDKVIHFLKEKSLKADLLGDNIVILCGYHEGIVDKK